MATKESTSATPTKPLVIAGARDGALARAWRRQAPQWKSGNYWKDTFWAYIYLAPTLIIFGVFVFYPVYEAFKLSLLRWNFISPRKVFIGAENYVDLTSDPLFWKALANTVVYVMGSVPITMALALFFAALLNSKIRLKGFFRTSFFMAYITPTVATALAWNFMYNRDFGFLNWTIGLVGLGPYAWLDRPEYSMPAVILYSIWKYIGFQIVIFLAGLQNIDRSYYEAAEIDGASGVQRFRHITFPLLTPTTFFVFIISIIGAFKVFTEIYVLFPGTNGGPLQAAMTIVVYLYNKAFVQWRMGYASAIAYVLFFILFVFSLWQMRLSRRYVHYD